jgi:hypothetical protein
MIVVHKCRQGKCSWNDPKVDLLCVVVFLRARFPYDTYYYSWLPSFEDYPFSTGTGLRWSNQWCCTGNACKVQPGYIYILSTGVEEEHTWYQLGLTWSNTNLLFSTCLVWDLKEKKNPHTRQDQSHMFETWLPVQHWIYIHVPKWALANQHSSMYPMDGTFNWELAWMDEPQLKPCRIPPWFKLKGHPISRRKISTENDSCLHSLSFWIQNP